MNCFGCDKESEKVLLVLPKGSRDRAEVLAVVCSNACLDVAVRLANSGGRKYAKRLRQTLKELRNV